MERSSGSDGEDDPIISEVDVCLAKDLLKKLYLFQYPVRPSNMTYDHTHHLAARMKPKQHKVELEISLDVGAKTYSESRGRHIAETVDGDRSKENTFHGPMMDRSLLSSVRATENSGKYVAGIFSDGVLHLTPVEGVIQLRPTFNYFDQADEVNKKNMKARQEDGNSSQSEDELMDAKPVQLRFSKAPQTENKKQAKEGQQEEEIDEMWLDMRYYQPQDTLSLNERNRLYCRHDDFEAPELTSTTRDYIKALQPQVVEEGVSTAAMPHGVISLTSLKKMELTDQIKALLLNAKVVQLRQICSLLSYTLDERVIISGLRQYARLVQGCWVVRSQLLYPARTSMPGSGVPAEKMWPSRDYILFCFNRKRLLSRKEIISSTKLPPEDLREMLEQMARQRPARGWEFLLPTDDEFLKRHQDIANEEYELWATRYKELTEELQLSEDNFKEVEMPGLKPKSPLRRRRNSNSFTEDPKKIERRRRSSQSSQGGSDLEAPTNGNQTKNIKKEHSSPSKITTSQQLANNIHQTSISSTSTPSTLTPTYSRTDSLKGIIKTEATSSADEKDTQQTTKKKMIRFDDSDSESAELNRPITTARTMKEKHAAKERQNKGLASIPQSEDKINNNTNRLQVKKKKRIRQTKVLDSSSESEEENVERRMVSPTIGMQAVECDSSTLAMEVEVSGNHQPSSIGMDQQGSSEESDAIEAVDDGAQIFVPPKRPVSDEERPPSEIFLKELKKFVSDSLRGGSLSLFHFKELLELRQKERGNILSTGVKDEVLVKAIIETGAIEIPLQWPSPKSVASDRQRVFVRLQTGESNDKYRAVVMRMFHNSFSLRKRDICEAFRNELANELSQHMFVKFMQEFAENRGGQWYLNGTYDSSVNSSQLFA